MLMHHISKVILELKNCITLMIMDVQIDLDVLDANDTPSQSMIDAMLLGMISKFTSNFGSVINSKDPRRIQNQTNSSSVVAKHPISLLSLLIVNKLFSGTRISYIFSEIFASLLLSVGSFDGLSEKDICTTICTTNGTCLALFVPKVS